MTMMRLSPLVYSAKCCVESCAVPAPYRCFAPEILCSYLKLARYQKRVLTKRPRVLELSEPKWRTQKFQNPCFCPDIGLRKVNIVRMEEPVRTRTEQLSYPCVGRLLGLKKHPSFNTFPRDRKLNVNRMIRKSLLSLYSRLSSTVPPPRPVPVKKWTSEDWAVHMKRIGSLATRKRPDSKPRSPSPQPPAASPSASQARRKKKPGKFGGAGGGGGGYGFGSAGGISSTSQKSLRRTRKLAKPKQYVEAPPKVWALTENMRNYKPSERILKISRPKAYEEDDPEAAWRINRGALHYKATDRIEELAIPTNVRHMMNVDTRENPFKTSPNALKAKTTQRMIELSKPKEYSDEHNRSNPFKISRNALKAKITPRLNELAQPRRFLN